MVLKIRQLNKEEQYACKVRDVKQLFNSKPDNVYVSFGYLARVHSFDRVDYHHPNISGTIIASASINLRDFHSIGCEDIDRTYLFNFFVIKSEQYTSKETKTFAELYLPELYQWYLEIKTRTETLISGVENMIIEWHNGSFIVHRYRYH